jgi:hypothetical protein
MVSNFTVVVVLLGYGLYATALSILLLNSVRLIRRALGKFGPPPIGLVATYACVFGWLILLAVGADQRMLLAATIVSADLITISLPLGFNAARRFLISIRAKR